MRKAILSRAFGDGALRRSCEFASELRLYRFEKLVEAPGVENIFQTGFGAIGAVAVLYKDAQDFIRHVNGFIRRDDDARIAREVFVARDAAKGEAKPDARRQAHGHP